MTLGLIWTIILRFQVCVFIIIEDTVWREIIGEYLFGEMGELKKIAKISCHQIYEKISTPPTFFQ